ncbi:MAG: transaldolase family protein, partial [Acidimicrobiia bacterium]
MGRIHDLHTDQGQSPWLDNLRRGWLHGGEMQRWIDRGVRGLTSNPSIFAKAMTDTDEYDADLRRLVSEGKSVTDAYWDLVVDDINAATALLKPVFDASGGEDGYVSVEVSPALAHDAQKTIEAARELDGRLQSPNLYIKVPATLEGIPAIETLIGEGVSVNVTLIFGLNRYAAVMEAYIAGLEAYAAGNPEADLGSISSVASFFISRVDVEVDRRLDEIGTDQATALLGTAAIANAKLAYQMFEKTFSGPRW